jgi:hypothetical protein
MMIDCGNQMAMRLKKRISLLGLVCALSLVWFWGCAHWPAPTPPNGIVLQPGHYVTSSYRARDFAANRTVYALGEFTVSGAHDVDPVAFQAQFQEALSQAFRANGLKLDPHSDTILRGTVQRIDLRGESFRFLTGKITAYLTVEGNISRGDKILFAFQDRLKVFSPVNPGPPAPKEKELLLNQAARTFATHLLNELLLYWPEAEGK